MELQFQHSNHWAAKTLGVLSRRDLRDLDSSDQQVHLPNDQINDLDHDLTDLPFWEVDYTDYTTQNSLLKWREWKSHVWKSELKYSFVPTGI